MRIQATDLTALTGASIRTNQARKQAAAATETTELDTVTLQGGSGLLAGTSFILPTAENVQKLSAALGSHLSAAFGKAGIPTEPPVDIRADGEGRIRVTSGRADNAAVEELLNNDPGLADEVRTTNAIASHAQGMERSMAFQREYLSSGDVRSVVAKYADLFGQQTPEDTCLRFDGTLRSV